jgi:hypothetical protein
MVTNYSTGCIWHSDSRCAVYINFLLHIYQKYQEGISCSQEVGGFLSALIPEDDFLQNWIFRKWYKYRPRARVGPAEVS